MEETVYSYFSKLISFSSTNSILLIIMSLFEMDFLLPSILEVPIKVMNYISPTEVNEFEVNYINPIKKISLYHHFQKLRNSETSLYSRIFLFLYLLVMILFFCTFIFCNKNIKFHKNSANIQKQHYFGTMVEKVFFNVYDHFQLYSSKLSLIPLLIRIQLLILY